MVTEAPAVFIRTTNHEQRNKNEITENIFVCCLLSGVGSGHLPQYDPVRLAGPGGDNRRYRYGRSRILDKIRAMKTKYKYIYFENKSSIYRKRKTQIWWCRNNRSRSVLGIVKWYSQWRQYCFFPDPHTVFNTICCEDIINFIKQLNSEHKSKNRQAPAALERSK